MDIETMKDLMNVAQGIEPADMVIQGGRILNVFTGETIDGLTVCIKGEWIAYVGDNPTGAIGDNTQTINTSGKILIPGFIDGHTHIAWMNSAEEFLKIAMTGGTTTIITEILEPYPVCGFKGALELLESLQNQPVKIFATAPAMVSISKRTRTIDPEDLKKLVERDDILGLGESYWQNILKSPDIYLPEFVTTLQARKTLEGHSAGASGQKLNAYVSTGISSCHEPIKANEVLERLRLGLHVMVREGSVRRELDEASKILNKGIDLRRLTLVSDGLSPAELLEKGYMDFIVQKAIDLGFNPEDAIRMVTLNVAEHFSIDQRIGSIAPGKYADIVVIPDLHAIKAKMVISNGQIIAQNGECCIAPSAYAFSKESRNSVRLPWFLDAKDFAITPDIENKKENLIVRTIELVTDLVTREVQIERPIATGEIHSDVNNDILKIAAIDRAKTPGDMFLGFIKGFGLKYGAVAFTAPWDSADIILVGVTDDCMAMAVNRIQEIQGGIVVCDNEKIIEELPLPIFGVLTDLPLETIADKTSAIKTALSNMGVPHPDPILTLATLTSPAIPFFRICEEGYVDLKSGETVNLFVED